MKKFCAFLCFAFIGVVFLQAQEAKNYFKNIPDSLCPLLTAVNRADFIDFLESNMKAEVTNKFGHKSEMTRLSSDYICVQMTPQSSWQMKLLSVNDSTQVICAISTVCAPACDSDIAFYSTDWKKLLNFSFLPQQPIMHDFMNERPDSVDVYKYQKMISQADMLLMKAELSAEDDNLTFIFTTPQYMEKTVSEKLAPFIKESIVYTWKRGKFIKE